MTEWVALWEDEGGGEGGLTGRRGCWRRTWVGAESGAGADVRVCGFGASACACVYVRVWHVCVSRLKPTSKVSTAQ